MQSSSPPARLTAGGGWGESDEGRRRGKEKKSSGRFRRCSMGWIGFPAKVTEVLSWQLCGYRTFSCLKDAVKNPFTCLFITTVQICLIKHLVCIIPSASYTASELKTVNSPNQCSISGLKMSWQQLLRLPHFSRLLSFFHLINLWPWAYWISAKDGDEWRTVYFRTTAVEHLFSPRSLLPLWYHSRIRLATIPMKRPGLLCPNRLDW